MATKWTSRVNPLSWITRRGARPAPVAPGGVSEYSTAPAYSTPRQDDFSAVIGEEFDADLEWLAQAPSDFIEDDAIEPTVTSNPPRPRTHNATYDEQSSTLRVLFRDGISYDYSGISPDQWLSLQRERSSTGKWMARNGIGGPGSGTRVG